MPVIDRGISRQGRISPTTVGLSLLIALVVSLMTVSFYQLQGSDDTHSEHPVPMRIEYTTHDPIYIDGNAGFLGDNSSTGISQGSGTAIDPYIIEGWKIDASSQHGIEIRNSDVYFVIRDCYVRDGMDMWRSGIYLYNCTNGYLSNNTCSNNYNGIYVYWHSNNNTLIDNNCSNNNYGISVDSSDDNTLINNTCSSNSWDGIILHTTTDSTLADNICTENYRGISIHLSSGNTLSNNNCSNNNIGINVESSDYITLINNTCSSNSWDGIRLAESVDNILIDNTCSNNDYGISLYWFSSNNTLINNTCSSNNWDGILLVLSSEVSNDNEIIWNQLCDNVHFGVRIDSGSSNMIWNNTFIGNNGAGNSTYDPDHIQAYDDGVGNWWNSTGGYGNYWSDWTTPDILPPWGIVDNPYNISGSAGAKDFYPQTTPPIIPEPSILLLLSMMLTAFLSMSMIRRRKQ